MLRLAPVLTLLLVLGPIVAGLVGAVGLADGNAWRALTRAPGLGEAILFSLWTGIAATLLSLGLVIAIAAVFHGRRGFRLLRRLLGPLLAVPHAAMAIGLAFLIAPSGWVLRLLSPWATGFDQPPDLALVKDPYGLALIVGLVVKETPFLLLMLLSALNQVDAHRTMLVARSLGYRPATAWMRTVWPLVYPQLRLPLFAVLAYALSVVDMALVLAPNTPPPLAVLVTRWAGEPDPLARHQAAAGAGLLVLLTVGSVGVWMASERLMGRAAHATRVDGRRNTWQSLVWVARPGSALLVSVAFFSLVGIGLWSIADSWRFPDPWPASWSLDRWSDAVVATSRPFLTTLGVGLATVAIAIVLVVASLENQNRQRIAMPPSGMWLVYAPLLIPQVSVLAGIQGTLVRTGIDGSWLAVIWSHLLYVLPYVYLSLAAPFHALDNRYERSARGLGASSNRVFWRIKLPLLLRPVLIAMAVGFAVSVAQYLPTVFAGGGRLVTLTTEAIALSSGGDRRVVGVFTVLQAALPFIGFGLALAIPAWLFRSRAGMQVFR